MLRKEAVVGGWWVETGEGVRGGSWKGCLAQTVCLCQLISTSDCPVKFSNTEILWGPNQKPSAVEGSGNDEMGVFLDCFGRGEDRWVFI